MKKTVSGEEFLGIRAEGRESRGESLLDDFSISEIWIRSRPGTGCASAETGSKIVWDMFREVGIDPISAKAVSRDRRTAM